MTSLAEGRLVWITQGERDLLHALHEPERDRLSLGAALARRFDAAPADPAEAVDDALVGAMMRDPEARWSDTQNLVNAVLRALGVPGDAGAAT